MVDTDVIIWILRGNEEFKNRFRETVLAADGYIFITPIQIAEIYAGIRKNEITETENFVESLNIITIGRKIGKLAGQFINQYKKSYNVTLADALIGASAKNYNFKLWTLNKKHYPMFEDNDFYS